jgi:hypothetical protein
LAELPFWKCDGCGNHVGTHHKTRSRTKPLGTIPSREMKKARTHIHQLIDPVWRSRRMSRNQIYAHLTSVLGRQYHTADLRTLDEARMIYAAAKAFVKS